MTDQPLSAQSNFDGFDAIASAYWAWERLRDARSITEQADAVIDLSNAMSDLASWHPEYDIETGLIGAEDG